MHSIFRFEPPSHIHARILSWLRFRRRLSPLIFSSFLCLSPFAFFFYQAEDGSGHERATTLLLDSDVVTGAEVRRISIGFEPDTGGRPKTP